jgi:hypothetical protein
VVLVATIAVEGDTCTAVDTLDGEWLLPLPHEVSQTQISTIEPNGRTKLRRNLEFKAPSPTAMFDSMLLFFTPL